MSQIRRKGTLEKDSRQLTLCHDSNVESYEDNTDLLYGNKYSKHNTIENQSPKKKISSLKSNIFLGGRVDDQLREEEELKVTTNREKE